MASAKICDRCKRVYESNIIPCDYRNAYERDEKYVAAGVTIRRKNIRKDRWWELLPNADILGAEEASINAETDELTLPSLEKAELEKKHDELYEKYGHLVQARKLSWEKFLKDSGINNLDYELCDDCLRSFNEWLEAGERGER